MLITLLLLAAAPAAECANPETNYGRAKIAEGAKACAVPVVTVAPPQRASTPAEKQAVIRYFKGVLKDGPSARWKWSGTWEGGWVCGEVNSKNSFGGYAGYSKFAYREGRGFLSEDGYNHWSENDPAPCLLPSLVQVDDQFRIVN